MFNRRNAMTLVEMLVVLGIMLLLTAMILPAILKSQALLQRLESTNNLRTIIQGIHQYAAVRGGQLPGVSMDNLVMNSTRYPLFVILPYLDVGFKEPWGTMGKNSMEYPEVKFYLSPTDITITSPVRPMIPTEENTSYSTNALVFDGRTRVSGIDDGMSYTIGISERYRECYNNGSVDSTFVTRGPYPNRSNGGYKLRTSTFADSGYNDVVPVTVSGVSSPSIPGVTFQATPLVEDADGRLLQSTQSTGLLTIMMDGSIRTFSKNVSPAVFWGAITPKGNEIIRFEE